MNAYELADSVDGWAEDVYGGGEQLKDAANMLRQQADHIAELEKEKENYKYDPETGEPLIDGYPLFSGLPTPQTKQLSDGEIAQIWSEHTKIAGTYDVKDIVFPFVRAIEERHGIK